MRKFEFVPIPAGFTKILLDSVEIKTRIDAPGMREYRYHLGKQYSVGYAYHFIDETLKKIQTELVLEPTETAFIIKYLRGELGI